MRIVLKGYRLTDERLLQAIDLTYQSVDDPTIWPTTAAAISTLLGAQRSSLVVPDSAGRFHNILSPQSTAERAYVEHFTTIGPFRADERADRARFGRDGGPQVKVGQEIISEQDLIRTEYYNGYAKRLGSHHMIGAALRDANPIPIAVFRDHHGQPFGHDEKR